MFQHIHNNLIQNFPDQLRKALDKSTNYCLNTFEPYILYDYTVGIYFLSIFLIQLEPSGQHCTL